MREWLSGQASGKVKFLSLSFILIRPTPGDGRLDGFIRTAVVQGDKKGVEWERWLSVQLSDEVSSSLFLSNFILIQLTAASFITTAYHFSPGWSINNST